MTRFAAWIDHAQGCRRRAIEYARWASEYPPSSRAEHYRRLSAAQWCKAHDAIQNARVSNMMENADARR